MARTFSAGSTEYITTSLGAGASITGDITLAIIAKAANNTGDRSVFSIGKGASSSRFLTVVGATGKVRFTEGGVADCNAPTATMLAAQGWVFYAVTKASAGTPRFHTYVYSTNTWIHEDNPGTVANSGTPDLNSYIGSVRGIQPWDGDIAIAGAWAATHTDAQIESMAFDLNAWWQKPPNGLWLLDQASTSMLVLDLTGNGANQSAITGTSVSANSVPVLSYGAPVVIERVTPFSFSGHGDIAVGGWASLTGTHVQITGHGDVSNTGRAAEQLTLRFTGHGDVATAGWASLTGTHVQITGHGDVAVTGSAALIETLVVKGHGDVAVTGVASATDSLVIAGKGTVANAARAGESTSLALSGQGNVANTGRAAVQLALPLAGHGDASTTGQAASRLAVVLSGHGDISTTATGTLSVLEGDHTGEEIVGSAPRIGQVDDRRLKKHRTHRTYITVFTVGETVARPIFYNVDHPSVEITATSRSKCRTAVFERRAHRTTNTHCYRRTTASTDVAHEYRARQPRTYRDELLTLAAELL